MAKIRVKSTEANSESVRREERVRYPRLPCVVEREVAGLDKTDVVERST